MSPLDREVGYYMPQNTQPTEGTLPALPFGHLTPPPPPHTHAIPLTWGGLEPQPPNNPQATTCCVPHNNPPGWVSWVGWRVGGWTPLQTRFLSGHVVHRSWHISSLLLFSTSFWIHADMHRC